MKVLDWICWCDSSGRDESVHYLTDKVVVGDLPEKPPVICTEQPRAASEPEERVQEREETADPSGDKAEEAAVARPHLDSDAAPNSHVPEPSSVPVQCDFADSKPMDPISITSFPLTQDSIQAYRDLRKEVVDVLQDRIKRLELLLEKPDWEDELEDDMRLARGKIFIIMKNNLTKFGKLIEEADGSEQAIADLTGFWGLVHPELEDVRKALGWVEAARRNGWKKVERAPNPPPPATPGPKRTVAPRPASRTPTATPKSTPKTNPKLRELMAQKRREMAQTPSVDTTVC